MGTLTKALTARKKCDWTYLFQNLQRNGTHNITILEGRWTRLKTSKTEVLQTPSATHVNRDHGVLVPKSYFSENIIFLKF